MVLSPPARVLDAFAFAGRWRDSSPLGAGHINATFAVTMQGGRRYVLQRVNAEVFGDVPALMANLGRILAHLETAHPEQPRLRLVPTRAGHGYELADGEYWRAFEFIEHSLTLAQARGPEDAWQAAFHFARFQAMLGDYAGPPLYIPLPGFHDTPRRLAALAHAAERDVAGRLSRCRELVAAYFELRPLATRLSSAGLPTCLAHNDAKLSNLLFDAHSGAGACVVDLDTVMPGLSLHDLGDLIRSGSCLAPEDCEHPGEMSPEPELLAALLDGWRAGRGGALSEAEAQLMLAAGVVLTLECGARFLTDFLDGDRYFGVQREDHNLIRARAQLALARALSRHDSGSN